MCKPECRVLVCVEVYCVKGIKADQISYFFVVFWFKGLKGQWEEAPPHLFDVFALQKLISKHFLVQAPPFRETPSNHASGHPPRAPTEPHNTMMEFITL